MAVPSPRVAAPRRCTAAASTPPESTRRPTGTPVRADPSPPAPPSPAGTQARRAADAINVIAESEFIGPYSASARFAYLKEASFSERMLDDGRWERNQFDQRKCWVVRTRCKVDDDGRMISANYAVVHNIELSCDQDGVAGICVIGAFNPTPNDTNLEPLRERRKRGKRNMPQR